MKRKVLERKVIAERKLLYDLQMTTDKRCMKKIIKKLKKYIKKKTRTNENNTKIIV